MARARARTRFDVGEEASMVRKVTDRDIRAFSRITGDDNPIHLDEDYARRTRFGSRIAHGSLLAGLISAVLGTKLPGPGAIYLGQTLRFVSPVFAGDTVTARVRVMDWDNVKGRIALLTEVAKQDGTIAVTGEAMLVMASFLKTRVSKAR